MFCHLFSFIDMQLIFICLLLKQHVLTVHKQPEISVSQSECDGLKKDGSGLQGQLQSQFEDSLCSKGKEKKKTARSIYLSIIVHSH